MDINNEIPPAYFKWAQIDEMCSCGRRGAVFQRKFEELIEENLANGLSLQDSRIEALKFLNIKKTCCLRDFTFFPSNFICSSTMNAYTDITKKNKSTIDENIRMGNNSNVVGWEFLPKTNNVFGFNLNEYCVELSRQSSTDYERVFQKPNKTENEINEEKKSIAEFPNYSFSTVEDQPMVACNIDPLSNEELTADFLLN